MSKQRNRKPLTHKDKKKRDERNERRDREAAIKNKAPLDPTAKARGMFLSPLRESKKTRYRREFSESIQKRLDDVKKARSDDQAS